jgi:3-oxoacyl-[acyl-carrier protein] reductase
MGKGGALSQDNGLVALVSGGSRGIGAAIVRRLAAAGWPVSFSHPGDEQSAREVEKAVRELGTQVAAVEVNMTDSAEVTSWVRRAEEKLGPVGAVVSCAGIIRDRPPSLVEAADWRAVIDTEPDGMFHLRRAAVFPMMKRGTGRIVTVSSVVGVYGHTGAGDDLAAEPGIAGFVKALATQTRRFGIGVNAVAPGPAPRDMTSIVAERTAASPTETIALRRFGSAVEVADLVAFLLSGEAAEITGTVLEVHAGISPVVPDSPGQQVSLQARAAGAGPP